MIKEDSMEDDGFWYEYEPDEEPCPKCGCIESGCWEVGCMSEEWEDEDDSSM